MKEVAMRAQNNGNGTTTASSYLEYLPGIFQDDEFMGQFLLIFESIMKPIENTVSNLPFYLDPMVVPEPLLDWLAYWLDLVLDQTWPLERRRELVKSAAELYRWQGTKRGLSEYLRIYTGNVPEIIEYIPGMRLDPETQLGINTVLGSSGEGNHFIVSLAVDDENNIDINVVRSIIEAQKPAHTVYTLQTKTKEAAAR
jgi:phage tail-like protein